MPISRTHSLKGNILLMVRFFRGLDGDYRAPRLTRSPGVGGISPRVDNLKNQLRPPSFIMVLQSTNLRKLHNRSAALIHLARIRCIFPQGQRGAVIVIVAKVALENLLQLTLIQHNHMIQAFSTDRSGERPRRDWLPSSSESKSSVESSFQVFRGRLFGKAEFIRDGNASGAKPRPSLAGRS